MKKKIATDLELEGGAKIINLRCESLTSGQIAAIASPAVGMIVHDSTLNEFCFYDGTTWLATNNGDKLDRNFGNTYLFASEDELVDNFFVDNFFQIPLFNADNQVSQFTHLTELAFAIRRSFFSFFVIDSTIQPETAGGYLFYFRHSGHHHIVIDAFAIANNVRMDGSADLETYSNNNNHKITKIIITNLKSNSIQLIRQNLNNMFTVLFTMLPNETSTYFRIGTAWHKQ
jgi:hypothetical protein